MKKVFFFFFGLFLTIGLGGSVVTYFGTHSNTLVSAVPVRVESVDPVEAANASASVVVPLDIPSFTVGTIFSSEIFNLQPTDVTLLATGDIIPARVTDIKIRENGVGYPFEKVSELLGTGDVVVGNLESPLTAGCKPKNEGMVFCGIPDFAKALKEHNIGVATLENNHIGNQGAAGVQETIGYLKEAGIETVRRDAPYIGFIKNIRFGFVAYNGVGPMIDRGFVAEQIEQLKKQVDVVVVSVHWGKEYTYDPVRAPGIAPDDPIEIGHLFVDSGADLVIGNHPHWVQGVEKYKQGFITYAHGNFIFDQEWSRETKEGVVGKYVFREGKLVHVAFSPVVIEKYAQPRLATDIEREKILGKMKESSEKLL